MRSQVSKLAAVVAGVALARGLSAQTPASRAATLSFGDAILTALRSNPSVRAAARSVDAARGAVLGASAAFDPTIESSVLQARVGEPIALSAADFTPLVTNQTTYALTTSTLFPNGITLAPQVAIIRTDLSTAPGASTSQATAAVMATIPLRQDRGGSVTRAPRAIAEAGENATAATARYTAAQVAEATGIAYWAYRAATERLAVQRAAEDRATHIVEQTAALIRADERPPADLIQVRASLASKRTLRINAEQSERDAWHQLVITMGEPATTGPRSADTPFPDVAPDTLAGVETLRAAALRRRADLATDAALEAAADAQERAAVQGLRSRLDLSIGVGYAGADHGWGIDNFFGPLVRNQSGMNASIQLRYAAAFTNARARAALIAAEAAHAQRAIATADLRRQIELGVADAIDAVRRGGTIVAVADSAVALSEESVNDAMRRFQLGANTVLDLLTAEDVLTTARLAQITARQSYAVARLSLAFETGTLLDRSMP